MASGRLSIPKVAERIGASEPTVRDLCRSGALPATLEMRGARKHWFVEEADLKTYIEVNGPFKPSRGAPHGVSKTLEQLQETLAEGLGVLGRRLDRFQEQLDRLAQAGGGSPTDPHGTKTSERSGPEVSAEAADLLRLYRAAAASQRAADEARATVVTHLMAAVMAGERVDADRRAAIATLETVLDIVGAPANPASVTGDAGTGTGAESGRQ